MIKKSTCIAIVSLLFSLNCFAQYQAPGRAILEPADGKVIFGIGQDGILMQNGSDETNGELTQIHDGIVELEASSGATPMLRHFYIGQYTGDPLGWTFENRMNLLSGYNSQYNHDYTGVFSFKFPSTADLDNLFNGTYDTAIRSIGTQAAQSNKPIFFRPFYEFNQYGDSSQLWIDYAAQNPSKTKEEWFIAAWIKFRTLVLEGGNNGNVAFVWCLLAANTSDFIPFYPGDNLVDWVGIDIFSAGHLANAAGPILDWVRTSTANKPVILPEVTPALGVGRKPWKGTQENQNAVDQFFTPLFNMIENNTEVKAMVYMNFWFNKLYTDNPVGYEWVVDVGLDSWADGRIQPTEEAGYNTAVLDYFSSKIGNTSIYMYEGQYTSLADEGSEPPPPSADNALVQDISLSISVKGKRSTGIANIIIVDTNNIPVAGATVEGTWSAGGATSAVTGADGSVTLKSAAVNGSGVFTFTVTNVSHATIAYDPTLNLETSESINY
ncbi:MAG: glycosyl hydrolase [Thalassotalea sp.]